MNRHPTLCASIALLALTYYGLTGCGSDSTSARDSMGGSSAEAGAGGGCTPSTCDAAGVECGTLDDGCGKTVQCGDGCGGAAGAGGRAAASSGAGAGGAAGTGAAGAVSTAGAGGTGCTPTTCAAEHDDCGTIDDGCGEELDCGTCSKGTCGAVKPNVCGCLSGEVLTAGPRPARRARSSGFSGTTDAYGELFDVVCEAVEDCAAACGERGGEPSMCDASQCLPNGSGPSDCLPPPVWSNLESIRFQNDDVSETVQLITVFGDYRDVLLTDQFKLEVPDEAEIQGITVEVRRAGEASVADDSVRIIKDGRIGRAERASTRTWDEELTWVTYGGTTDLWGEAWSPADLRSDDFGVALSAAYTRTAGNARAYVDEVRVTVHYDLGCSR